MIGSVNSNAYASQARDLSKLFGTNGTSSTSTTSDTKATDPGAELFGKLDQDQSGGLSSTELQSFVDKMSSQTRGALLSVQEGTTASTSSTSSTSSSDLFTSVDSDGDGSVSETELDTYMKANRPDGPPPGPPPSDQAEGTSSDSNDLFSAIDGDGDGSITETELDSFVTKMQSEATASTDETSTDDTSTSGTSSSSSSSSSSSFDAMDTNQDGSVSQSELDAYMRSQAADAGPPPPPPPSENADSTSTSTSSSASTSSTTGTSATSSTTTDLAAQLTAAMADFATKAYSRQSSTDLSSLLVSSIGAVA